MAGGGAAGVQPPACLAFESVTPGKPCVRETQTGSGTFAGTRFEYTYFAATHVTREDVDYDDGVTDATREEQFDDAGHRIRESNDTNADGAFEYEFRWEVAEDGKVMKEQYFDPPGGIPMVDSYEYNERGLLATITRIWADGTLAILTTYAYDQMDRQISVVKDVYADGEVDERATTSYSADGRTRTRERDADGDGVVDQASVTTSDERGNDVRAEYDDDADGMPNSISTFAWNECDGLAKQASDSNADGTIDDTYSYDHDDDAMVMSRRHATAGKPGSVTKYVYADGVLQREETDEGANGTVDRMLVHLYGAECLMP